MLRLMCFLLALGLVAGTGAWITAQDGPGSLKRPLDLPSGGLGGEDDEEDGPEVISFYGAQFEADAFFWCLDKSGSMAWGGRINVLKAEVTQAINSLSNQGEFGLVAYSTNTVVWNPLPQRATTANKVSATAWVANIVAAGWTCLADAGVQTLGIANQSFKQNRKVIVVGDGEPICQGVDTGPECLANITAANYLSMPIDTLYVSTEAGGIAFMQELAAMNGGTFILVQ